MSQVKNLRAMFESKGDTSPPDSRGRSPTAASTTSEAPRPLSKIRTSFVAVEKDGRIGLKRDQSGDSSVSRRRLSNDTEPSLYRTRSKMSTQDDSVKNPASESIPEAPDAAEVAIEQPSNTSGPADTAPTRPKEATPAKSATPRLTPTASKVAAKPAATKKEPTSRTVTKPIASTRATGGAAAATKKPAPVKTAASETGFVKPKPKSPTKPVNLPSSLMAPTASSAHKGGASRQSNLPQSASAHAVGTSTASKPVKRQNSVATRPRPSLGVPPASKVSQDSTSSKRQSHVDEGFLARMMRPTAASSSKTTEKGAPPTPPKKTAPRISNVSAETVRRLSKSPVPNRAASAARPREATSRAEKTLKPSTTKTVAKAATTAASIAGAAVVASKVVPESTASKLADKPQNLGIEEPEEDPKQEMKNDPEVEPAPVAELDSELEQHPEHETATEPEPEVEDIVEATAAEEAEAEAEPEVEQETLEEPEEHVEEPDTVEDTHPEVEEGNETVPIEHIEEPEPVAQEEEPAVDDVTEAHAKGELHAHEEAVTLEEAALEAAQVETAEEAIEIAEEADPEHLASFDDATKPAEPVIEHPAIHQGAVGNGFTHKLETESASALPQVAETNSQHTDKAAADETVSKDADTAA